MDKAKAAVKDFVSRSGHHDTTIHETVAPAVTNETVNRHHHEEQQKVVDREVHQDHFHTSVQPVKDREVLPEQHEHNLLPVQHREHHHGQDDAVKAKLAQEQAQFRDTRTEGATTETFSKAPTVAGEHVHHHVHENIQPVVQKETIQPSVVHTTAPVHEVIHKDPTHHATSGLPAVSLADFKKQGGTMGGREERFDSFAGEPRSIGNPLSSGTTEPGVKHGTHTTSGPHGSDSMNKLDPRVDSDRDGSRNFGAATTTGSGTGTGVGTGTGYGTGTGVGTGTSHGTGTGVGIEHKKPSLMDRLNPKKDTDGDGKAGIMD